MTPLFDKADKANRKFMFDYTCNGCNWGITIFAEDEQDARQKIKKVANAELLGEVFGEIHVPLRLNSGFFSL